MKCREGINNKESEHAISLANKLIRCNLLGHTQIAIIIKDYSTLQIKDYRMLKFNSVDRENVRSQVCRDCNYNQGNDR